MTNEEAKEALQNKTPVVCGGIEYKRLSAIIYRYDDKGKFHVSAELLDKKAQSLTIARLEDVQEAKKQ